MTKQLLQRKLRCNSEVDCYPGTTIPFRCARWLHHVPTEEHKSALDVLNELANGICTIYRTVNGYNIDRMIAVKMASDTYKKMVID